MKITKRALLAIEYANKHHPNNWEYAIASKAAFLIGYEAADPTAGLELVEVDFKDGCHQSNSGEKTITLVNNIYEVARKNR